MCIAVQGKVRVCAMQCSAVQGKGVCVPGIAGGHTLATTSTGQREELPNNDDDAEEAGAGVPKKLFTGRPQYLNTRPDF